MLLDYRGTIDTLELRRHLDRTMTKFVPSSPRAQTGVRVRCRRGLDTPSAVGLAAEISDFTRSKPAGQLMSCAGLAPAGNGAGHTHRPGQITKTGSRHARSLLGQAAWHDRNKPAPGITLQRRQDGQAARISMSSWPAHLRPAPPVATLRR